LRMRSFKSLRKMLRRQTASNTGKYFGMPWIRQPGRILPAESTNLWCSPW
jgi:hypothetical protein